MADDPRLSVQDRLRAKAEAWQKQHGHTGGIEPDGRTESGGVGARTALWQQKADQYQQAQATNPFSGGWKASHDITPHKEDQAYGRPKEGSKTEYRGKQAGVHISKEIVELCGVIEDIGLPQQDGTFAVTFGTLFEAYTKISNKLVGMLMRARKQKLVNFKGEMLFQRRDDDTIIWLVQRPQELLEDIERRKEALRQHEQHSSLKK